MLTFYDYLPSQNAWKVRQILAHTGAPFTTRYVSIFEGEGHTEAYLAINPWGAVPAIRLDDGRALSESNAILWYLADGTAWVPADPYLQAKVLQWMSFEADYIQTSVGSLRYWTLTGKLSTRPEAVVDGKRVTAERALLILDEQLAQRPFLVGDHYTIADISMFAYAHAAEDAGLSLNGLPHFRAWVDRVRALPGHVAEVHPYSIDPNTSLELP